MLMQQDLREALTSSLLGFSISTDYPLHEHGYDLSVDFWHVEQMYNGVEIADEFDVLSP